MPFQQGRQGKDQGKERAGGMDAGMGSDDSGLDLPPRMKLSDSGDAVPQARFIRNALEMETDRTVCALIHAARLAALGALIEQKKRAVAAQGRKSLHALDDAFHREIAVRSGVRFVWGLTRESKRHIRRPIGEIKGGKHHWFTDMAA